MAISTAVPQWTEAQRAGCAAEMETLRRAYDIAIQRIDLLKRAR